MNNQQKTHHQLTITLPKELYAALREESLKDERPISQLIARAVKQYLSSATNQKSKG